MPHIRIIKCNEVHELPVSNSSQSVLIPVDGKFHHIDDSLIGALEGSSVEFEVAAPKAASQLDAGSAPDSQAKAKAKPRNRKRRAAAKRAPAGGAAAGLGPSAAAPLTQ